MRKRQAPTRARTARRRASRGCIAAAQTAPCAIDAASANAMLHVSRSSGHDRTWLGRRLGLRRLGHCRSGKHEAAAVRQSLVWPRLCGAGQSRAGQARPRHRRRQPGRRRAGERHRSRDPGSNRDGRKKRKEGRYRAPPRRPLWWEYRVGTTLLPLSSLANKKGEGLLRGRAWARTHTHISTRARPQRIAHLRT